MGKLTSRFEVTELPLSGLILINRKPIGDDRGYLERLFCNREFEKAGWDKPIAQINHTFTAKTGTVRGMHFQRPPHAEKKLVMCLRGRVFDVVVDIREDSSSFLKWHGQVLSPDDANALLIPEGFAHGFQTLTPDVEMLYFHSEFYAPENESGVRHNDPAIGLKWPLEVTDISERDKKHPLVAVRS